MALASLAWYPEEKVMHAYFAHPVESGGLRESVEARFDMVKAQTAEDGGPIIFSACLDGLIDVPVSLPGGPEALLRYLPARRNVPIVARTNRGALLWFALQEEPAYPYRVTPRRRPNTERHFTLVDPQHNVQEFKHLNQLRAGLCFLYGMGRGYSGFFNATGASDRESFHFQFFGMQLPLWVQLDRGTLTVTSRQVARRPDLSVGHLSGWPFTASVFESHDPDLLAAAIWDHIQGHRRYALDDRTANFTTDVLLSHGTDGILRAAAVVRDRSKVRPQSFWPEDTSAYGDFGGLELCGLIVTIKSQDLFQKLSGNGELAAERLCAALSETAIGAA